MIYFKYGIFYAPSNGSPRIGGITNTGFLPFALFRKIIIGLFRGVIPEVWRGDISVQVEMSPFHCCCSHPRQQQKNSNMAGKRPLLAKLIGAFEMSPLLRRDDTSSGEFWPIVIVHWSLNIAHCTFFYNFQSVVSG